MILNNSDILSELGQFVEDMFQDLKSGLLFFGGPFDVVVAVLDILATTLVVFYILKILRDSRAWQLLKGVLLIVAFAIVCSLAGLTTVGFIFNNTISILAIAFVILFQPELRRALETVGRNSFNVISSAISQDEPGRSSGSVHNLIESIVRACEKLAETRTGALIILERQTRLGELIEQENVVQLDAAVSATMLMQVFYKGSPLHDGAVLIPEGRLTAARVHVPLSDNYHLRKDYGTRHRAAIGASEMGDAIAVVVSEERGCISIALEGRLYTLDNADALRTLLHKLLGPTRSGVSLSSLGSLIRGGIRQNRNKPVAKAKTKVSAQDSPILETVTSTNRRSQAPQSGRMTTRQRLVLMIASLAIAIGLWLYVQVAINPVGTRTFVVALNVENIESVYAKGYELQVPSQSVQVTLQGRGKALSSLTSSDVIAFIDLADIDTAGNNRLTVQIETVGLQYYMPIYISPTEVTINVQEKSGN
ncbi:MAG TPA: TIGR00159 family protein [Clostridiales bacterium]|nr:TIGR00159 family protein [Clostridiales bacterium]